MRMSKMMVLGELENFIWTCKKYGNLVKKNDGNLDNLKRNVKNDGNLGYFRWKCKKLW